MGAYSSSFQLQWQIGSVTPMHDERTIPDGGEKRLEPSYITGKFYVRTVLRRYEEGSRNAVMP